MFKKKNSTEALNKKLRKAVAAVDADEVRALLHDGADANASTAEFSGDISFITYSHSLALKCYILLSFENSRTPAYFEKTVACIKAFAEHGADLNVTFKDKTALMHFAAVPEILEAVLPYAKDIDIVSIKGNTIYHYCAQEGLSRSLHLLLQKQSALELQNKWGNTPLHLAAQAGKFDTVKMLVEMGANCSALNKNGSRPFDLVDKRHAALAEYLMERTPVIQSALATAEPVWALDGDNEVYRISFKEGAGYKLTEFFNFEARTYRSVMRNLQTNAESQALRFFAEMEGVPCLQEAVHNYETLGGKLDARAAVKSQGVHKKIEVR